MYQQSCFIAGVTQLQKMTAGTSQSFTHGLTQIKFNMISILSDFYLCEG